MSDLKKAELYIQQTCKEHFIELEDLKSRRSAGGLSDIKREIVHTLYHDHKLTQKEIARIFGKSEQAICVILQHKTKKEPVKVGQEGPLTRDSKGNLGVKVEECPGHIQKIIYFTFKDHPELYNHLLKTARANFRKPEDHILYLINKEREGHYENNKALQTAKKEP